MGGWLLYANVTESRLIIRNSALILSYKVKKKMTTDKLDEKLFYLYLSYLSVVH